MKIESNLFITSSGGHATQALAIANHLGEKNFVILENDNLTKFRLNKIGAKSLLFKPWRKKTGLPSISEIFQAATSIFPAFKIIRKNNPQRLILFGGYIVLPFMFAGKFLGKKIIFCEANDRTKPSICGRFAKIFANKVLVPRKSLCKYYGSKGIHVNYIFWKELISDKKKIIKDHNINPILKTIVITGGTKGFESDILRTILTGIDNSKYNICFATGSYSNPSDFEHILKKCRNFFGCKYFDSLLDICSIADVIICRGGLTPYELANFGKAMLIIPEAHASESHQDATAKFFGDNGAASVLFEKSLTTQTVKNAINHLMAAKKFGERAKELIKNQLADLNKIEKEIKIC